MNENTISYHIRGAIYEVYKALGPGLLESVYEEALTYELQTLTYLRLTNLHLGILVNFNVNDILVNAIHRVLNGYE